MTDSKASLLDSQLTAEPAQPEQMADAYATRLMDELFDGVERALEGDVEALEASPQSDMAEPPQASEFTLNFTEGGLPAVLLDHGTETQLATVPNLLAETASASEAAETDTAAKKKNWKYAWTLNRALLGAAGLTILATLGLWLQQRQQVPEVASAPVPVPAEASAVNTETEFLEYLRRSLDVIAQNVAETSPATGSADIPTVALNNGAVGLPPIGNNVLPQPGSGVPTAPGSINVIERVYVPYPSAQMPANYATAQGTPANSASSNSSLPSLGAATAAAPTAIQTTLLGVLELGDRSAALFEIDGTPQRVYIGERIGNSGWSLVSVANEEAVVRRNGEVRTLYIGQQF